MDAWKQVLGTFKGERGKRQWDCIQHLFGHWFILEQETSKHLLIWFGFYELFTQFIMALRSPREENCRRGLWYSAISHIATLSDSSADSICKAMRCYERCTARIGHIHISSIRSLYTDSPSCCDTETSANRRRKRKPNKLSFCAFGSFCEDGSVECWLGLIKAKPLAT